MFLRLVCRCVGQASLSTLKDHLPLYSETDTFRPIPLLLVVKQETIRSSSTFNYYATPRDELLEQQGKFWQQFIVDLEIHGPYVPPLNHPEDKHLEISFDASDHRGRPDYLQMMVKQWEALSKSHTAFVEKLRSREYRVPYNPGTRGIVTTAGGAYLPVALVSIRMLRETNSDLPVEVFLSTWSEWDPVICSKILPSLNARCIVLQDVMDYDKKTSKHGLEKYQYKIMSILFSSFEEVLFLDSDCFPIHNANDLFESAPFNDTGLVLWPDFWFPSESFLYFQIAAIPEPKVYERASTEAGEILYSKSKHDAGLLLATYYNYYGPNYYYPLLSQGAPGEGDKETFMWSAIVLGEPFYHVTTGVRALGYQTKDGQWRGSAMAQFDPMQDFDPDHEKQEAALVLGDMYPRPYFVHVNLPKLDPGQIFDYESFGATGPTKDSDQNMRRIWFDNEEQAVDFFGFDLEKKVWNVVREIACEYENAILSWKGKKDICKKALRYWDAVFKDDTKPQWNRLTARTRFSEPSSN
ncbi:mannosyltransferase [Lithohypha guttulata]|uniref:Mannosyltransferase n=1 Tax=Lithohypha guttulata TaxID=1690604 RepID=A0AAN7SUC6_9EURO|nr:mannosyltransferase [Lithohypha guttulata]KAK5105027.1 mannosyltransferase [Lithohypha guttulata]